MSVIINLIIISPLLTSGLVNLFKGASIPAISVPYNLIEIIILVYLSSILKTLAVPGAADLIPPESSDLPNSINNASSSINWLLVIFINYFSFTYLYGKVIIR